MPDLADNDNDDIEEQEAEVNRTLFIRSLPDQTTEDELYELFLQAGPLEKVAVPQNKNMAFITFKHSVSAPYAKELFCETHLHGRMLNVDFRTGSVHTPGNQRRSNHNDNRGESNRSEHGRDGQRGGNYQGYTPRSIDHSQPQRHDYGPSLQQNGLLSYPGQLVQGYHGAGVVQHPFMANPHSMPNTPIQGYRSSVDNREYVPPYVSFESPPDAFRGGVPINHPGNAVTLQHRRERLLNQQRYVTQADLQRSQSHGNYGGRRR